MSERIGTHGEEVSLRTEVSRPPRQLSRDCMDCGEKDAMHLQNPSAHFTTLYVCVRCGTMLTIPPPERHW